MRPSARIVLGFVVLAEIVTYFVANRLVALVDAFQQSAKHVPSAYAVGIGPDTLELMIYTPMLMVAFYAIISGIILSLRPSRNLA